MKRVVVLKRKREKMRNSLGKSKRHATVLTPDSKPVKSNLKREVVLKRKKAKWRKPEVVNRLLRSHQLKQLNQKRDKKKKGMTL